MNILEWLDDVGDNFTRAVYRYPCFFILSLALGIYGSIQLENKGYDHLAIYTALIIGGLSTLIVYNIIGQLNINGFLKHVYALLGWLIGLGYYYLIDSIIETETRRGIVIAITIFCIVLLLLCSPFFKNYKKDTLLRYLVNFLENFIESLLLSLVLYLVMLSAIYAIDILFDMKIQSSNLYGHMAIWISAFFFPLNFLSHEPNHPIQEENLSKYNTRFFNIFISYIGIPVVLIYGTIILAYVVKYLITGITKDWTISLFTWFLALGLLITLMNKVFIKDNDNDFANLFNKHFPLVGFILSLCYMFISYVFIDKNGITISSYYAAMFSVASIIIFGLLYWKVNLDYRWIYYILIGCSIFSITSGPIDCINASSANQSKRLITFLKSSNRLNENGYKYSTTKVNTETAISLLNRLNHVGADRLDELIRSYDKSKFFKDTILINQYSLFDQLGIQTNDPLSQPEQFKTLSFTNLPEITFKEGEKVIPIINSYIEVKNNFTGLALTLDGSIKIYEAGIATDSLKLNAVPKGTQILKLKSLVKNKPYEIYFTNMYYEETPYNNILIKDILGIAVLRQEGIKD
jgi:hypothetical protein